MKALLIAGGLGTRLRPLTHTRPKHLLPIGNRPHIIHVLDLLERSGIKEVILLTSYLAEAFAGVMADAEQRGMSIEVAHEPEPRGTAGAIKNAQSLIGDGSFFAFNGDVLTDADLEAMLRFHQDSGGAGTILLTPVADPSAYGVVPIDDHGRVERFVEKPPPDEVPTNLINAGVYILEPSILDRIPPDEVVSIEREVFPGLASDGRLFGMPTDAYWMDIGTPEKYRQANLDWLAGRVRLDLTGQPAQAIAPSATVDGSAQVSSACIGARCVIESSAVVRESVLLDDVVVGSGARVISSVLGEAVRVAPGITVESRVAGDGEVIES